MKYDYTVKFNGVFYEPGTEVPDSVSTDTVDTTAKKSAKKEKKTEEIEDIFS